jgi:hypothetical protein
LGSLRYVLQEHARLNYSLEQIVEQYEEWVSEDVYMIFTKWNRKKWKNDVYAVKCSKRGNDVYRSRVESRFRGLTRYSEDIVFFNTKNRGRKETSALWVTLTYDTKRCLYGKAWENIGVEFNGFMSYLRRNFGKISSCRVFEAFENGHPHIHCILIFKEHTFSVFRDSKNQFRIREKEVIAQGWHSNVDVKAMSSIGGGLSYLKKYLLKGIDVEKADSKGLKTLALCWAYRKRAFSVSGQFRKALTDLITDLHNSNKPLVQVTLTGERLIKEQFFLIGFVKGEDIQIEERLWFVVLNPKQIGLLDECLEDRFSY